MNSCAKSTRNEWQFARVSRKLRASAAISRWKARKSSAKRSARWRISWRACCTTSSTRPANRRDIVGVGVVDGEGDDRTLARRDADDAQRIDRAEPLLRIGAQA